MLATQHVQRQRNELQPQYDLLSEKISRLRISYTLENDPATKFKLEQQIAEAEREREKLVQNLDHLEQMLVGQRVYEVLLRLNYQAQVRLFREVVEIQRAGAFLISGQQGYGQRWLLNRLLQLIPYAESGKSIPVDLTRKARKTNISALWRELTGHFDLPLMSGVADIVGRVYDSWQTQNVILVFSGIDVMTEQYLKDLLVNFWIPLTSLITPTGLVENKFCLFMFIIDNSGLLETWNVHVSNAVDSDWTPQTPTRLPMITPFSQRVLEGWIENAFDILPPKMTKQVDSTVQQILDQSDNGVPEDVLEVICAIMGYNWYEGEHQWLKI